MSKTQEPKRMGRPELPPEHRTKPRTIWMTDAEWAKVQAAPKGWVRGLVQRALAVFLGGKSGEKAQQ